MNSHRRTARACALNVTLIVCVVALPKAAPAVDSASIAKARQFIAEYEATVRPLEVAAARADWAAQASGKDEDYRLAEQAFNWLDAALAEPAAFGRLKEIKESLAQSDSGADPVVAREMELLYLQYAGKQLDPELLKQITAKSTAITQAFNTYRAKVNGEELTDSAVRKVLRQSRDSGYRRNVWQASKSVGGVVEKDLKELVKLRNQAAQKLGFPNFYEMKLQFEELSKSQVLKLFDELDELTREPFRAVKADIDARLAADYGISAAELRPWHYHDPFFQEPPAIYTSQLDPIYAKASIVQLASGFYAGIGLPVDDVIARSDLYERPGKYPHAMCNHLDREGDVRVMANVVPNHQWMGTMLHELGHAVYDKNIPRSLPYVLRTPAHTFTTEAVAMLFERLADQPGWMQEAGLSVPDPKAIAEIGQCMHRDHTLVFAAWSQVMVRFEASMYDNPEQDLNKLWWDLVEKYQLIHRPDGRNAPDYASKIHIVSSPVYYHSYMMGQMFASQLARAMARDVLKSESPTPIYNGKPEIGSFLKERLFAPGARLRWDELVRQVVGEDLGPKAMMAELKTAQQGGN